MSRIIVAGDKSLISPESFSGLEEHGYALIFSSDLHNVFSLVLDEPPDLLIVDKGFHGDKAQDFFAMMRSCMQKTNMPILLVLDEESVGQVDWEVFPVDDIVTVPFSAAILLARIRLAESRVARVFDNNPLSRLPGNTSLLKAIQSALDSKKDMCVCYVDIDNFKPYNDRYGFSRGDEVIVLVARLIVNTVEEIALKGSFVGHIGGDDYVFIVDEGKVNKVCEKIIHNFDLVRNMFLNEEDIRARGFVGKDR
jgi:GGDEF domain-containing protein